MFSYKRIQIWEENTIAKVKDFDSIFCKDFNISGMFQRTFQYLNFKSKNNVTIYFLYSLYQCCKKKK